eukprot:Pgem_evm1s19678
MLFTLTVITMQSILAFAGKEFEQCRCVTSICWPHKTEWTKLSKNLSSKAVLQKTGLFNPYEVCSNKELANHQRYKTMCSVFNHQGTTSKTDYSGYEQTLSELFPGAVQTVSYGSLENLFPELAPLNEGGYPNYKKGWIAQTPTYSINAQTDDDVVHAVQFAKKHNLRLIVKNTGHDFYGRSVAPIGTEYSLQLWTAKMKGIVMSKDYKTVTVRAGETWESVYTVVGGVGRMVYGGSCASVGGAGGFTLGGGQAIFNDKGLAAENVLSYKVVLSDGRIVEVSKTENSNLFTALNGGGGGSFGVVLEITYKTFSITPSVGGVYKLNGFIAPYPWTSSASIYEGKKKIWGAIFDFAYKLRHKDNIIGTRTLGNTPVCHPSYINLPSLFELKVDGDEKKKSRLDYLVAELKEKINNVQGFLTLVPVELSDIGEFFPSSMDKEHVYYNNLVTWDEIDLPPMFNEAKSHWRDGGDVALAQLSMNVLDQIHIPTTVLRTGEAFFDQLMEICNEIDNDVMVLFGKSSTAFDDDGEIVPPVEKSQTSTSPEYYEMGAIIYPGSIWSNWQRNLFRAKKNS